jgi:hypothetical protein
MLNRQRINAVEYEMELLDQQITEFYEDGYMVDADRLLDRRWELAQRRAGLAAGLFPNG